MSYFGTLLVKGHNWWYIATRRNVANLHQSPGRKMSSWRVGLVFPAAQNAQPAYGFSMQIKSL